MTAAERDLDAGDFSTWMEQLQGALRDERDSDVPCDGCTACCTSSQFVHIGPEETDALAHIPPELLFPAPRMPRGHVLMGYDQHGQCPMLIDERCSIYEHRPRTCRTYDCRVFTAAGLDPGRDDKAKIAERARRWRFRFSDAAGRDQFDASHAAAQFLLEHPDVIDDAGAMTTTQLAVLSAEIHELFGGGSRPGPEAVRVAVRRRR